MLERPAISPKTLQSYSLGLSTVQMAFKTLAVLLSVVASLQGATGMYLSFPLKFGPQHLI